VGKEGRHKKRQGHKTNSWQYSESGMERGKGGKSERYKTDLGDSNKGTQPTIQTTKKNEERDSYKSNAQKQKVEKKRGNLHGNESQKKKKRKQKKQNQNKDEQRNRQQQKQKKKKKKAVVFD